MLESRRDMDLYGQEAEAGLLAAFVKTRDAATIDAMELHGQRSEDHMSDVGTTRPGRWPASDGETRNGRAGEGASRVRVGLWPKPRIGHLAHYEPRPLKVPAKYVRVDAPKPPPKLSIVTPSFEQGRFLARTLYSVISQRYPDLEYVVQDGASTDGTREVLKRFGPLLTRWTSEPDEGQADAINRGFAYTSGEIMGWLNSDDLLLPGSLAYVARYFTEHPEVEVVYGHRVLIDETDSQIGAWILPAHDDLALTLADYVPQETLFWRRRVWDAAGARVDPSFHYALDWDLLLRFREAGAKMVRLPRYLGAFRVHDQQKSTAADASGATECALLHKRVHGRPLTNEEVLRRLTPYFFRHILVHTGHRTLERLPLRRVCVQTSSASANSLCD